MLIITGAKNLPYLNVWPVVCLFLLPCRKMLP